MIFPVGGRILGVKFYTSNTTWTRPDNCTSIIVAAIGGGGGGGGFFQNGSSPSTGSSGGTTTFGSLISCSGGTGSNNRTNGTSGTASAGPYNLISPSASTKMANAINLFTYGAGGYGGYDQDVSSAYIDFRRTNVGGSGGFGLIMVKENLLNSYAITIGAGGAAGSGTGGEAGNAGAVLVIEFGG
jgi:hypothetical protein